MGKPLPNLCNFGNLLNLLKLSNLSNLRNLRNLSSLSHSQLSKSIMEVLRTISCKIVPGRGQWTTCRSGPYPLQWSTSMRVKLVRGMV